MTECCGEDHNTLFCPSCGEGLAGDLKSLLRYCETHLKRAEERLDFFRKKYASDELHSFKHSEKLVAKWRGWVNAIREVSK